VVDNKSRLHNVGNEIPFNGQSNRGCVVDPPKDEIGEGSASRFSGPKVG